MIAHNRDRFPNFVGTNLHLRNFSYWFITSLAICDILMVVISLVHLVPATAFHTAFLDFRSIRNIIMMFLYDFFWYTAVLLLGLMALNRFAILHKFVKKR